jgi:hypothetical protein
MKDELTDIVVVLDRSGSMASVLDDTIGGFNTLVEEQKAATGRARLTLTQFDDEYEIVHERRDVRGVEPLSRATYVPRGSTALLDAVGRTIMSVRAKIARDAATERPGKVVFVIITDGQENSSREFRREGVFELIREQESQAGWEFVYLGAHQDAITEAASLGIARERAANWKKARLVGEIAAKKLRMLREHGARNALDFDDDERKRLDEDDDEGSSGSSPRYH